jgi:protein TonB
VIAAVIGVPVGRYWFQSRPDASVATQAAVAPVADSPAIDPTRPGPAAERSARAQTTAATSARDSRVATAARAAAQTTARLRAAKKARSTRAARTPARTTLVAAPAAANVTLAASAPPPVVVASVPPPPPPPPPAVGPFFEMAQVNQPPRVASQVEPRLPDHQAGADVVVLRVLVSQAGHASQISMLRRARAGRDVDDAVVAAVKRWTFTPATKRGQAVSCWFNVAVPLR